MVGNQFHFSRINDLNLLQISEKDCFSILDQRRNTNAI